MLNYGVINISLAIMYYKTVPVVTIVSFSLDPYLYQSNLDSWLSSSPSVRSLSELGMQQQRLHGVFPLVSSKRNMSTYF